MIQRLQPVRDDAVAVPPTPTLPALPTTPAPGGAREVEISRLWRTLVRRRVPMLATFLGLLGLVTVVTLIQPRSYTTQVKMIVGQSGSASSSDSGSTLSVLNAILLNGAQETPDTIAALLQTAPVAQKVVADLNLPGGPQSFLGHIAVTPVTDTSLINVAVSWSSPEMSAKIANDLASVFVERERGLITQQADTAITTLGQQLPDAESRLHDAEATLAQYERSIGVADITSQTSSDVLATADLDSKRRTAIADRQQSVAQLAQVNGQLATTPPTVEGQATVSENPVSAQLEQQVAAAQVELQNDLARYTNNHPAVIAARQRLAELQRELAVQPKTVQSSSQTIPNPIYEQLVTERNTLAARISADDASAQALAGQLGTAQNRLKSLPDQSRRIGELQSEVKSAQAVYDALRKKYQEATIAKSTAPSDVSIVQAADPTVFSKSPNVMLNLAIGSLLGLLLGVTVAFGLDFFDDRMRSEDDVAERTGLPVLAKVPMLAPAQSRDAKLVESMIVESFFELVTQLRYSSETPPRSITITSPSLGDGKSLIAVNTAISMASLGAKVLVIDADLRRPSVHSKLTLVNEVGLSDVLVGIAPLMEAVKPAGPENVWALTAGMRPPNPVALLQSDAFDRLLRAAKEKFDFIVVDAPALGPIVDALIVGMKTEGTVLVVSATNTEGRATQSALAKLRSVAGLNVLGIVLNNAPTESDTRDSDYYSDGGQVLLLPKGSDE